ncbi:helix-turn-helix domain-containing protein [Escherichia coli]|uniref:helix-turn-helix domain-containing protein n=1 Tax=Escherichia coli TaxID=562 RepID=UPI0006ACCA9C|nr:helix-turn-helix domain-containing protein [Escherichia coli]EGB2672723.1 helix-turn-helix domain-containing protein [Escherichia coli]EJA1216567.1 helix-turn-helix domain-containing protein [Escherichia coli]MCZ0571150.1 helix-turn-helix domain-containing protein [Escherichia coli]HAI7179501.1 helix-turn-helix domain-containing protein [Escherichia coli]HAW3000209.1 helix-turn-helix domain-containing protein [Escherichia coli]
MMYAQLANARGRESWKILTTTKPYDTYPLSYNSYILGGFMLKLMTVNAITQYIDDNLDKTSINIDDLVAYSGYSRRYLQLLFKRHIGMAVGRYIQLRRVSRAAVFLRLTDLSLSEISERLLYDSPQTFSREFKKNTGYTPLQYRNSNVWSFMNLTGFRDTNTTFPAPKLYELQKRDIYAEHFICCQEEIPYYGLNSLSRIERITSALRDGNKKIFISNLVEKNVGHKINIHTMLWLEKGSSETKIVINKGIYASWKFVGTIQNYIQFINHIYMNVLPFYGLNPREGYDIETFKEYSDDELEFNYFLPVTAQSGIETVPFTDECWEYI